MTRRVGLIIVKFEPRLARIILIGSAVLCLAGAWFFVKWNFANAIASRLDPERPESIMVADWLTTVAPSDPQTHFAAAFLFEKTFDPDDLTRSLVEFEAAAALSPNHYVMWLNLGKARSLNGDTDGARAAFRRALVLAPNYAAVQWAYGNFLIRQGETEEGFGLIAKAAASNPEYTRTAALMALEMFDGNLEDARRILGQSEVADSALAAVLAGRERFTEAVELWSNLKPEDKSGKYKNLGESLAGQMIAAKKFSFGAGILAGIRENDAEKPVIGQVGNGGFENDVKARNAGPFEWQIAEGAQPQIGRGEAQPHGGRYSLFLMFNTAEISAFRPVSQTIPVAPGGVYELEVFYKSDLKSAAAFKWEIADAVTGTVLSSSAPLTPTGEWTRVGVRFTVPPASDGVVIRLARDGCPGPTCPTNGKLSFDDFSIRRL